MERAPAQPRPYQQPGNHPRKQDVDALLEQPLTPLQGKPARRKAHGRLNRDGYRINRRHGVEHFPVVRREQHDPVHDRDQAVRRAFRVSHAHDQGQRPLPPHHRDVASPQRWIVAGLDVRVRNNGAVVDVPAAHPEDGRPAAYARPRRRNAVTPVAGKGAIRPSRSRRDVAGRSGGVVRGAMAMPA